MVSGISRSSVNRHPLFLPGELESIGPSKCVFIEIVGDARLSTTSFTFLHKTLFLRVDEGKKKFRLKLKHVFFCQAFDNVSEACTHSFCCNRNLLSVFSVVGVILNQFRV